MISKEPIMAPSLPRLSCAFLGHMAEKQRGAKVSYLFRKSNT